MHKKLLYGLASLLVVGVLFVTILSLWTSIQAGNRARKTNNPPIAISSATETMNSSVTRTTTGLTATTTPRITSSPTSSTRTPTPVVVQPTGIATTTATPPVTASIGLNALSDYGKITYGLTITLYGSKFATGEPVQLIWEYQQRAQFTIATSTANNQGLFNYTTNAPSDPAMSAVNVAAIGKASKRFAIMSVPEIPNLFSNPYPALQGSTENGVGGNFGSNEKITLLYNGSPVASGMTDARGAFSINFPISPTAQIGTVKLQAVGQSSGLAIADVDFYVTYNMKISPTSGSVGTQVTVTGLYFPPSTQITMNWLEDFQYYQTFTTLTTSSTGSFTTIIIAPSCPVGDSCQIEGYMSATNTAIVYFREPS
jgi:hypothetical protein